LSTAAPLQLQEADSSAAFKAEKDPEKIKFLMRHDVDGRTTFVCDNGELQKKAMTDVREMWSTGSCP
jgi:hypothetical protein